MTIKELLRQEPDSDLAKALQEKLQIAVGFADSEILPIFQDRLSEIRCAADSLYQEIDELKDEMLGQ